MTLPVDSTAANRRHWNDAELLFGHARWGIRPSLRIQRRVRARGGDADAGDACEAFAQGRQPLRSLHGGGSRRETTPSLVRREVLQSSGTNGSLRYNWIRDNLADIVEEALRIQSTYP